MMDCCTHRRGLNSIFDERRARDEVDRYWQRGIDRHAQTIVDALLARGVSGASLLEVGGGIGGLHAELLKHGASHATNVDISSAYLAAAQSVAARLGIRERVDYQLADFAREAEAVPAADVVIMHRVVCCYPDMPGLVSAAARHARHLVALSFPRSAWYIRLFMRMANAGMWLQRSGFRFYVHAPAAILGIARSGGLVPAQQMSSWPWQIVVFERQGNGVLKEAAASCTA